MFSILRKAWITSKFKRNDLNIIEGIDAATFSQIIETYCSQGWELKDTYRPFDPDNKHWTCQLRKGSQILHCTWRSATSGEIVGMSRIIQSMAVAFSLKADDSPSL